MITPDLRPSLPGGTNDAVSLDLRLVRCPTAGIAIQPEIGVANSDFQIREPAGPNIDDAGECACKLMDPIEDNDDVQTTLGL